MPSDRLSPCLDDDTIAAFVSGGVPAEALASIDAHLGGCPDCQALVGAAAAAVQVEASGEGPRPPWAALSSLPERGDLVGGKYRAQEVLGQGGMGVVMAAVHAELGHRVAIKFLTSDDATAAARFLREGQTCARLVDPHIVRVFDLGRLPSGVPYLVMEHLLGETLEQRIERAPLPLDEALACVRELCAGLATAHAAGVIHRDLKPSNLFLVQRQGRPLLKLLDFGMSKRIDLAGPATTLTLPRTLLGSPSYMSPEQALGGKVDARTDIWSLGVILYQLVAGRRPFVGATLPALLLAIATQAPAPVASLLPRVPGALEALLAGCLQKDVAARIPSVALVLEALDRVERELRASAAPTASSPPARRGWLPRPLLTLLRRR